MPRDSHRHRQEKRKTKEKKASSTSLDHVKICCTWKFSILFHRWKKYYPGYIAHLSPILSTSSIYPTLFPTKPIIHLLPLFFNSNPPPQPSNGSWFCVALFHNSIPGVLFRSITYFVGFVSIVMAAWRLCPLATRGSDQLGSLSSFGHRAHFIFGDLCNLLFYFFPYIFVVTSWNSANNKKS